MITYTDIRLIELILFSLASLNINAERLSNTLNVEFAHSDTNQFINDYLESAKKKFEEKKYDSALMQAQRAYELSSEVDHVIGKIEALKLIGYHYYYNRDSDTALSYLDEAFVLASNNGVGDDVANIGIVLSLVYLSKSELYDAIKTLSDILVLDGNQISPENEVLVLYNLSSFRSQLDQYDESEDALLEALTIASQNQLTYRKGQILLNLGDLEFRRNNYGLANQYFDRSLNSFVQIGERSMSLNVLLRRCELYSEMGYYDLAIQDLDNITSVSGSNDEYSLLVKTQKAKTLYNANRFSEAELVLDSVFANALQFDFDFYLYDLYQLKYKLAERDENLKEAYLNLKLWLDIKNHSAPSEKYERLNRLTKKLDFELMTKEVAVNASIRKKELYYKNLLIGLIVSAFSLVLISFLLNRKRVISSLMLVRNRQKVLEMERQVSFFNLRKEVMKLSSVKSENEELTKNNTAKLEISQMVDNSTINGENWAMFRTMFEKVYPRFNETLSRYQLTVSQEKIACLIILGLSNKEISQILNIQPKSVIKSKSRLAEKLRLESPKDLAKFLNANF